MREGGWEGVSLTEWAASPKSLLPPSKVTKGRNGSLKKERRVRKLDLVKVEEEFGGSKGTEEAKQSSTGGSFKRKGESSRGMEKKDRLSLIREDSTSLREKDDFEKQVHVVQTLLQN